MRAILALAALAPMLINAPLALSGQRVPVSACTCCCQGKGVCPCGCNAGVRPGESRTDAPPEWPRPGACVCQSLPLAPHHESTPRFELRKTGEVVDPAHVPVTVCASRQSIQRCAFRSGLPPPDHPLLASIVLLI